MSQCGTIIVRVRTVFAALALLQACAVSSNREDEALLRERCGARLRVQSEETDSHAPCLPAAPPSEDLAAALRLYQRGAYRGAAALFERVVAGETDESQRLWRQHARLFLARTYARLHRPNDANRILVEIAEEARNPYRTLATATLCGEDRAVVFRECATGIRHAARGAPPPPVSVPAAGPRIVPSRQEIALTHAWARSAILECGSQNEAHFEVAITFLSDGSVGALEIVSDRHDSRATRLTQDCVFGILRQIRVAPFERSRFTVTYPLSF